MCDVSLRSGMFRRGHLSLCFLFMLSCSSVVYSQDQSGSLESERDRILKGIRESRLAARRGIWQAEGKAIIEKRADGNREGIVKWMAAFDDVNNRLRFDRMNPIVRNDPATGTASVEEIGYQFARTREKTIFIDFIAGMHPSNCVFIGAADFTPPDNGSVIDWRTFGLMGWDTIDRSVTLERALKRLEEIKVTAIVHEADGKRRLTLAPNAHVKAELLVDTQRGFTVEQYNLWERRNEGDDWGNATVSGHLKWAQNNDVWLPEAVQFENFGRDSRSCSVTFTWTHVNEPLPDRLFEASSFNVVPGALVMDARKGD